MNILILTHSYPDENNTWRGAFIRDQARALSLSHNVKVVYFKVDYSHLAPFTGYKYIQKSKGFLTEFVVTTGRSLPVINQLKYLYNSYKFICDQILDKERIDIIHSHLSYPAGFLGTIIQKIKKIPCVITEHSWIRKHFRSPVHKICVLYAVRNCSCIVAVSEALKSDIRLFTDNRIMVVNNVIKAERFTITHRQTTNRINLGILGGMNTNRKGIDVLLKALALIPDRDIQLHIGGDGLLFDHYKKSALELGISGKCTFYGQIMPDRVTEFYSLLDIYVLASRDETFGVVVIEAMASGLPVISTKCGGPEEIVIPENGILVEIENENEMADAISYMSENLESYDKVAIKKYAEEKFGQKAFLKNISKVYEKVLLNPKSRISL